MNVYQASIWLVAEARVRIHRVTPDIFEQLFAFERLFRVTAECDQKLKFQRSQGNKFTIATNFVSQ